MQVSSKKQRSAEDPGAIARRLNAAVVHLNRRLRRADMELGLPTAQASALTLLVAGGPHTVSELAGYESIAGPTMTRLVPALKGRGLARRIRDRNDLRRVHVEATPIGRALIERGRSHRIARLQRELAALSAAELHTLAEAAGLLLRLIARPLDG